MDWETMVTIGRIVRPQGNRGEVVIAPDTDFGADRFRPGETLRILRNGQVDVLTVTSGREHDGRWVVGIEGIGSINDAETLRGLEVRIPEEALRPLGDGAHYVHDLAGCRVETTDGTMVGTVRDVQFGSGAPLLVIDGEAGEVLVPFNDEICRGVDIAGKRIVIAPPEGLLRLNA